MIGVLGPYHGCPETLCTNGAKAGGIDLVFGDIRRRSQAGKWNNSGSAERKGQGRSRETAPPRSHHPERPEIYLGATSSSIVHLLPRTPKAAKDAFAVPSPTETAVACKDGRLGAGPGHDGDGARQPDPIERLGRVPTSTPTPSEGARNVVRWHEVQVESVGACLCSGLCPHCTACLPLYVNALVVGWGQAACQRR